MSRKEKSKAPPIEIRIGVEGIDYELLRLEKTQGEKSIYKLEYDLSKDDRCTNYIDDENKHVVFKDKDGRFVIIKLPTRGASPVKTDMIEKCEKALAKKRTFLNKNVQLAKDAILIGSCAPELDLSAAQDVLEELNRELRRKCPNLHFKLAPYFEYLEPIQRYGQHGHMCIGCQYYNTMILALCNDERCISSIELLMVHDGEIMINSKTDEDQEDKKYNKLLRALLAMVANKIEGFHFFKSKAMNPVSTWLLLQYSNARIDEDDPFIEFLNGRKPTKELIQEYYPTDKTDYKEIKLTVDLNSENAAHAYKQFKKIIADGEIVC
jgi:hypothetical protein